MKTRLAYLWDEWRSSYWFVPTTTISAIASLAVLLPWADFRYQDALHEALFSIQLGTSSVRVILAAIIGAMTTIIGLVFSLTVLTLSTASTQFGPRLLRTFLESSSTQFALGTYIATTMYSLLLLALVRDDGPLYFVPYLSLSAALLLAVFNLAYLVQFIHNIAQMLQAPNVVDQVAHDLDASIDRICPECIEFGSTEGNVAVALPEGWFTREADTVCAKQEGYLQGVDIEGIVAWAQARGVSVRMRFKIGQFIYRDAPIMELRPRKEISQGFRDGVNEYFVVGARRTPLQDIECALEELVEVAVRAMSPGVNDPFTAINCIDRLGASLSRLAGRKALSATHEDEEGVIRLIMMVDTFGEILNSAFDQIRQHSRANTAVLIRLLEALTRVAEHVVREGDQFAIRRQLGMIANAARESVPEESDIRDVEQRVERVLKVLENPAAQ